MNYGTTPLFLEYFGLRSLEDLPAADELRRVPVEKPPGLMTIEPGLATAPPADLNASPAEAADQGAPAPPAGHAGQKELAHPQTSATDPSVA